MTEQSERMVRVPEGRLLAGACTGLGAFTGIDPLVYRVGFVLLALAGGQGVLLYIAAVLLMPAAAERWAVSDQLFRRRFDGDTVLAILGLLLSIAVLLNLTTAGLSNGNGGPAGSALTSLTILAVALLVAHARGVDLTAVARSMPERLHGRPLPADRPCTPGAPEPWGPMPGVPTAPVSGHGMAYAAPSGGQVTLEKTVSGPGGEGGGPGGGPLPEGMIDLADYSTVARDVPPAGPRAGGPGPERRTGSVDGSDGAERTGGCGASPRATGRTRSILTPVTLLVALIAAAVLIPVATDATSGRGAAQIMLAAALGTAAIGLIIGSVTGRGRGLVAVGTLLSISLLVTSIAGEVPVNGRYGDVEWHPVDVSTTERSYRMIVGDGRLDLTDLPLTPGGRVIVNARFVFGELQVTLPRSARAELHLKVGLGDIMVDRRITSGPGAKVDMILTPETAAAGAKPSPPVIELHVLGRIGDLEVTRA